MQRQHPTLVHYHAIEDTSGRMLEAARRGDWDTVAHEEARCREFVRCLQSGAAAPLSEEEQRQKIAIIRKVLADDAEIRTLAEPWLKQLEGVLSASGNSRRLVGSYGRQA